MENSVDFVTEVTKKFMRKNNILDVDVIKDIDREIRRNNGLALYTGNCQCCNYNDTDQLEMYVHINSESHYRKLARKIKEK